MIASLEDPFNFLAREIGEPGIWRALALEIRYPFLYRPLVEYCLQVPLWLKERHGQDKWFHRQAMKGLLPEMIRQRSDKAEFSVVYRCYADEPCVKDCLRPIITAFSQSGSISEARSRYRA